MLAEATFRVAKIADTSKPVYPLPSSIHAVAMYIGGDTPHVATVGDWQKFPKDRKLPMFVRSTVVGRDGGEADGWDAVKKLRDLGVPKGSVCVYDRETNTDAEGTQAFGNILHYVGFECWPYGSTGNIFEHPALNGYFVADPTSVPHMYDHPDVMMTQFEWNTPKGWDESEIRLWQLLHKLSAHWTFKP